MKGKKIVITALEVLGGVGAVNWLVKLFNYDLVMLVAAFIGNLGVPVLIVANIVYFLAGVGGVVILMKLTKQGEKVLQ